MFKKRGVVASTVSEVHFLPDRHVGTPHRLHQIDWNAHIQYPSSKRSFSSTPAPGYVIQRMQVMKKQPLRFQRSKSDRRLLTSEIRNALDPHSQISQELDDRTIFKNSQQFPIFENSSQLLGQYQVLATTKKIEQIINNQSIQQSMKISDSLYASTPTIYNRIPPRRSNKKRADLVVETQNEFYAEQSELRQTLNQVNVFKIITQMEAISYKYFELFNQTIKPRQNVNLNQSKAITMGSSQFRKFVSKSQSITESKIALSIENSTVQAELSEQKHKNESSFLLTELKEQSTTSNYPWSEIKLDNTMNSVDNSEQQSQDKQNKVESSKSHQSNEEHQLQSKTVDIFDGIRTLSNVDSEIFDFLEGIAANKNIQIEMEVYNNLYISYKRDFIDIISFYITETTQYVDFSKISAIEMKVPKNINIISIFKGLNLQFSKKINVPLILKYINNTKNDTQFKFYANYNICLNFTKSSLLSQYKYIVGKPFYLVALEAFIYNFFYILQTISDEQPDYLVLKLKTTEIDYLKQLLRKQQKEYYGEYDIFLTIFKKYLQLHEQTGHDENYIYFLSLLDGRIDFNYVKELNTILGERQLIARHYKSYTIQIEMLELIVNILNHYERFIQSEFNMYDNILEYLRPENIQVIQQIQVQLREIKENGSKPIQNTCYNDFLF